MPDDWRMGDLAAQDLYPDESLMQPPPARSFWDKLGETTIGKIAKDAYSGVTAPGDAWSGKLQVFDPETGRTTQDAIERSANLGGLVMGGTYGMAPAGAAGMAGGKLAKDATPEASKYLINPQREFSPGIYKRPDVIAAEANAKVAPEHPALKELFGVTRQDLYDIGGQGTRQGNMPPSYKSAANPKGSYVGENIATPANEQRLIDVIAESGKYPGLRQGMDAWYVMDPAYQRLEKLVGPELARQQYRQFNTVVPMFSPSSDVLTEITRGTAANQFLTEGRLPEFMKYGGMKETDRAGARGFPAELRDVPGHPFHSTAQAGPVGRYAESGQVAMSQPKVPLYMQASGVPQVGFQTSLPVADAHFARGVGAADVRTTANPGVSLKGPEYGSVGPWFREKVAKPAGLEAVPAQARIWGAFGPQTGVDTMIGAPKLEILAEKIWNRAQRTGQDPHALRDRVLLGRDHAQWLLPGAAGGAIAARAGMGDLARQDQYD